MEEFKMNKGTVKWFNNQKGYGFITSEEGNDVFVHYSSILMDGRKTLHEDDIVEFEIGEGTTGRKQAVNVNPILTMQMVTETLKNENLSVIKDNGYYVVVNENDTIQSSEHGMSFEELVAYAGLHYPM